jgi:CRISPR-associated protein Csb1
MSVTLERLRNAVAQDAAIRRVQKLQPAGGPGDKIFPSTYRGEGRNAAARHIFETRRIDGEDLRCVLIDSVQSQANRLEEALLAAVRNSRIAMPFLTVDFKGQKAPNGIDISDLGEITSLDAPHRVFDAIIRDSELDGVKFTNTRALASQTDKRPSDFQAQPNLAGFRGLELDRRRRRSWCEIRPLRRLRDYRRRCGRGPERGGSDRPTPQVFALGSGLTV